MKVRLLCRRRLSVLGLCFFQPMSAHLSRTERRFRRLIRTRTTVNLLPKIVKSELCRLNSCSTHIRTIRRFVGNWVHLKRKKEPCHQTLHKVVAEIRLSSRFPTALGKLRRLQRVTGFCKTSTKFPMKRELKC